MRKILPVGSPAAYGYQFYAFPLAILANEPRARDWILSNFVQVAQDLRGQHCEVPFCFYLFDYALCPWLDVVRTTRSWLSRHTPDIGDVIRDAVLDDQCVYLIADDCLIPDRKHYRNRFFPHDILVHGFDDEARTFQVLGYDARFQFRSTTVPRDALVAAHASLDRNGHPDSPVLFYRLRPEADYRFDVPYLAGAIGEYLDGANTSEHFRMLRQPWARAYGVDSYPFLTDYAQGYEAGDLPYDVRHFHVLWEHKRLMALRLARIAQVEPSVAELVPAAEELATRASALRNSLVRTRITRVRPGFARPATALLAEIEDSERALLTKVLGKIGAPR